MTYDLLKMRETKKQIEKKYCLKNNSWKGEMCATIYNSYNEQQLRKQFSMKQQDFIQKE